MTYEDYNLIFRNAYSHTVIDDCYARPGFLTKRLVALMRVAAKKAGREITNLIIPPFLYFDLENQALCYDVEIEQVSSLRVDFTPERIVFLGISVELEIAKDTLLNFWQKYNGSPILSDNKEHLCLGYDCGSDYAVLGIF